MVRRPRFASSALRAKRARVPGARQGNLKFLRLRWSRKDYKRLMTSRFATLLTAVAVAVPMPACQKGDKETSGSNASAAALDACTVGTWKSTEVTLDVQSVHARGGANVELKIEATGACSIDFTPMMPINATAKPTNFDFYYVGKATGTLKTTAPGSIAAATFDYTGLKAFATVQMPNGSKVPLLTNVPVTSMVQTIGSRVSPASSSQGIDSAPVMSADSYTCSASTLTLSSSVAHTRWSFSRVAK